MADRMPDFVIIGAAKAGSTTLFGHLSDHPGVFSPRVKEPDYFVGNGSRAAYTALFDGARPDQIVGEGSTRYTFAPQYPDGPARIKAEAPAAKLIYILRDPVERARSHVRFDVGRGKYADSDPVARLRENRSYVDWSLYAYQLERYLEHFPREQVLVVLFEDLRDDPIAVMRRVEEFLGLPAFDYPERWDNATGVVRHPKPWAKAVRSLKLRRIAPNRAIGLRKLYRRFAFTPQTRTAVPVPDEAFAPYLQELAEDRARLVELTGVDVGRWKPLPTLV